MGWLGIVAEIAGSRLGNIGIALVVGLIVGWWKTDASWHAYEKQQQAAAEVLHQMEIAREETNTVEIAKAATERVEEDQAAINRLQDQVDAIDKAEADAKNPCLMDARRIDAARRMRQPPARTIHPAITRPSKRP